MLFLLLANGEFSEEKLREMQRSICKMGEEKQVSQNAQTVHIVFGDSPGGSLRAAFRETDYEQTEAIIVLPDMLSVGPLKDLHIEVGIEARFRWFQERYNLERDDFVQYKQRMLEAVEKVQNIPPHQDIVIWTCQNAHEQTGLRLVLAMLKDKLNSVFVLDTFKAFHEIHEYPQLAEDHYPKTSGELTSEELLLFYEQYEMRPLQKIKRQTLCGEGAHMLLDNYDLIRTWEHRELWHNNNVDRDDAFIIACAKRLHEEDGQVAFRKAARVIGEVLGHMEQYRGDDWLEYRLRCLVEQGVFAYRGDLKAMYYEVKLSDEYLTNH